MLGIRAVGEKREHALFAVGCQRMQVEFLSIQGSRIDFEVTGMDDCAGRCLYRERKCIDDRVRHMEELHRETAGTDLLLCFDRVKLGFTNQTVLFELVLDQRHREARAVHRNIQVWKNERECADMVFVAVCEKNSFNFALVLEKVRDVGNDNVDAQQFLVGKHDARIHHDDRSVAPERHHVHTKFAKPAKSNYIECLVCLHLQMKVSRQLRQ